jgi:predicted acyltransferase
MNSGKRIEALTIPAAVETAEHRDRPLRNASRDLQPLWSLDALGGFDMFWIIGGSAVLRGLAKALPSRIAEAGAAQLQPVSWQGLHCYDVIWPLFLFLMGAGMRLSLERHRAGAKSETLFCVQAARRAVVLFVIGMVAQGNLLAFDLSKFHPFSSILHGAAAGYLIATFITVKLQPRWQAAAVGAGLLTYWALLMLLPVPGIGAGALTPEGNAAAYVDRLLLGRFQYGAGTWFLSYLGFASSVVLGGLAGEVLLARRSPRAKVIALCGTGAALMIAGLIWSIQLPIIRLIWTGSYVLICGGISFLLLALFYALIDVYGFRKWAFGFTVIGLNAITVYVATTLFDFRHIGNIFVGDLLSRTGAWAEFLEASATFAVVWLILYWMYRSKTFVRL